MKSKKEAHITELRKNLGVIWQKVNNMSWKNSSVNSTELTEMAITRSALDAKNTIHKANYFSVGDKLYDTTTKNERSFLFERIALALKMNNSIVPKPRLTERENRVLNSLISKNIISRSGRFDYILVNPEYLRRGNIITVIAATYERLRKAETDNKLSLYVALKTSDAVSRNISDEEEVLE